ncbi:MAG: preprotein translocase subunit YajC [Deltaproteobacteria bacterium]|nr:preprotein translocase subunit YajC [Deltaproteobacteria bacterium]
MGLEYFYELQNQPSFGETILHLIPVIIGVFLIFYFVVILPTSKEEQKKKEAINNLKKGDTVEKKSGFVVKFIQHEDQWSLVELAPNVRVRVDKNTISKIL